MSDVGAAAVGAAAAMLGIGVGSGVTLWVERTKLHAAELAARRAELLRACSAFMGAVTKARFMAVRQVPSDEIDRVIDEARVECERLRILADGVETQEAARMVLRHLYALRTVVGGAPDPRADEYHGLSPRTRFRNSQTTLYRGVRRQLGVSNPDAVFDDLS